jgi:hypothetical protein
MKPVPGKLHQPLLRDGAAAWERTEICKPLISADKRSWGATCLCRGGRATHGRTWTAMDMNGCPPSPRPSPQGEGGRLRVFFISENMGTRRTCPSRKGRSQAVPGDEERIGSEASLVIPAGRSMRPHGSQRDPFHQRTGATSPPPG